jgi:hypothetical protein
MLMVLHAVSATKLFFSPDGILFKAHELETTYKTPFK